LVRLRLLLVSPDVSVSDTGTPRRVIPSPNLLQ
jgi:hypothetical protein